MADVDLERLFRPRSVAILGASNNPGKRGQVVLSRLIAAGFKGDIYPVNRTEPEIQGLKAYPTPESLPDGIDLMLNVLPVGPTPDAVVACARKGVKFAVVYTAGFSEVGDAGRAKEQAMVRAARAHGMRIVGPNCLGMFSLDCGLNLTGFQSLARGPLGVVSQSGNVATTFIYQAKGQDIGFSRLVGVGNQADLAMHEFLAYLGDDEETRVIALYMESLQAGQSDAFLRVAQAVARRKPIVGLKGGRTANGRRAAASHTAVLAGDRAAYSALFRQAGIVEVEDLEDVVPMAEALYRCPPFTNRRIAVIGSGGGHSVLSTDALESNGLEVPPFTPETHKHMAARLPSIAPAGNPVDMTGSFTEDLGLFSDMTEIAFDDQPTFGAALNYALYGLYGGVDLRDLKGRTYEFAASLLGEVQARRGRPIVFYTPYAQERLPAFIRMREAGVPCYASLETAARALGALHRRGLALERLAEPPRTPAVIARSDVSDRFARAAARPNRNLLEPEVLELLQEAGFPVAPWRFVATPAEAAAAATALGFPVVLKLVSPEILHKSDVGGVQLGLATRDAVEQAAHRMAGDVPRRVAGASLAGFIVARQVDAPRELLVGFTRNADIGAVVAVGIGGVFAEVIRDTALGVLPLNAGDAAGMLRQLRGYAALTGARGSRVDIDKLAEFVLRVGDFAAAYPEIRELDLNPIMASATGLSIVDARAIVGSVG